MTETTLHASMSGAVTSLVFDHAHEPRPAPTESSAQDPRTRSLRVGLVGFGRTGRDVARVLMDDASTSLAWVARQSDRLECQTAADVVGIDGSDDALIHSTRHTPAVELLRNGPVDVIIDFSSDSGLDYYAQAAEDAGTAIVSAVSRYPEAQQRRLAHLAERLPVLWSPNITLGINFLLLAGQTLQRIAPLADVQVTEEHFRDKKEVSGTALRLARALGAPHDAVHVTRAGGIIGVHEVLFGLPTQTVRLRHESISREAFGEGAVFAAAELVGRDPGMYRMEDLLAPYFTVGCVRPAVARGRGGARRRLAGRLRDLADRLDL